MTPSTHSHRPTWIIGGALLVVLGVLVGLSPSLRANGGVDGERAALAVEVAAACVGLLVCVLHAVGLRAADSVVARRWVGMVSLVALGIVWVWYSLWWASPSGYGAGPGVVGPQLLFFLSMSVLSIVATVSIGRARVLPRPWNWAPLAGLGIAAASAIIVPNVLLMFGVFLPAVGGSVVAAAMIAAFGVAEVVWGVRGAGLDPAVATTPDPVASAAD
ncbi:hypothetical protein RS81_01920 [Microbacterium terrae]|uniref:Uncharacterized protein n=2 Tax=Microbacterium terrae TaxID=69369 RepID=A0A0M2H4T2_9MICO|nr:hypothetical protein RS81_01920 [Microbacterium terrae]GLK00264.1 hypothetical protein GCM10017594_34610 [Microbacterium terrae]